MRIQRSWTEFEIALLKSLAHKQFNAYDVARAIGRSPSSVYTKAAKLGLKLAFRRKRWPYPGGDPATWDEAQRICAFANVPMPLAQLVADVSSRRNIPLKAVRSDRRADKLVKCRAEIATIARSQGYSFPLIGRALNRDHTTVIHAIRAYEHVVFCGEMSKFSKCSLAEDGKIAA